MRYPARALLTLVAAAGVAAGCATEASPEDEGAAPSPVSPTTEPPTTVVPSTSATASVPVDVLALAPPAAASNPEALAAQIEAAEQTIRDPTSAEHELAEAALAQQVAYRRLGMKPEWDEVVLAALPAELRPSAERHVAARREFRGMHTKLSDTLPPWEIVAPEPADQLLAAYQAAEAEFAIPWRYLAAINLVETGIGRIRGTSTAGAQGPMQFMPATWAAYGAGGDVHDTHDAIMGAARYLAANNGTVDIDAALYRYNNSQRYVRGVKLYAELIAEHPRAFFGFYHWGVWYLTTQGDVYLPVGYEETTPVPVADHQARD